MSFGLSYPDAFPSNSYRASDRTSTRDLGVALDELEGVGASFADRFLKDSGARAEYRRQVSRYVEGVRDDVRLGRLSTYEAARQAQAMRNCIMDASRMQSSEIGRALATFKKRQGYTFVELQEKYAQEIFHAQFDRLPPQSKGQVWATILRKAGDPNGQWNRYGRVAGHAGRGL